MTSSSSVNKSGHGANSPLPSGETAGVMSISVVFSSLGGISIIKKSYLNLQ
jgi:hypothetical protein